MTEKQTDENIDDIDAPGEAGEATSINTLEEAAEINDHDALLDFANRATAGGDEDDVGVDDVDQADSGYLPENQQQATDTNDKAENNNAAAAAEEGAATANDKGEQPDGDKAGDGADATGAGGQQDTKVDGVLTKDGKHVIPYAAHTALRERAQTAEARLAELEQENQSLKQQREQAGAGDDDTSGEVRLSDEQQQRLDRLNEQITELEEEYGEQLAAPLKASLEVQKDALLENARLKQDLANQQAASNNSGDDDSKELEEIQAAIDANSVMATWQARNDDWYKRSIEIYQTAMANDPEFQSKSVAERFAELPNRVQAVYGKDKSLSAEKPDEGGDGKPADQDAGKQDTKQNQGSKQDESGTAAFTMSDIPGGATPDGGKYGPVENASPQDLQRMMDQAAETGKLEDMIANWA